MNLVKFLEIYQVKSPIVSLVDLASVIEYEFLNKEEPKLMTREEAIDKVLESGYSSMFNRNSCKQFINTLEALGLIKFKERELFKIDEWNAVRFLKSLGYTVRKNG